ncbi:HD-GYP domain-containing protein [Paenibacillus sp. GP183]|uniref:HD-GYP domain-containing protein n=1 Tax=Paenibacillus sp. GP183 TaxID=1882751 RepID=UPI000894FC34|nr:HD-GYP domain-containing protein [Paenibacillus sp. GP183]SEC56637.1 HD-GYP domain, c-di-GMP phosphodiesterase class II (or its inactivated variant) [Paenibacillus sp. GP183]
MRKVSIQVVNPGDKLARDITMDNGNALLVSGRELNTVLIQRLKAQGIDTVYIEDKLTEDIRPFETLNEETRLRTIQAMRHSVTLTEDPVLDARAAVPKLSSIFRDVFRGLLNDIMQQGPMLIHLADLFVTDDYLFHQAINVTALSIIVGVSKGYSEKQLEELGIGALLADIGMVKLPKSLWNKQSSLSAEEREQLRRHPEEGYLFLRKQEDISMLSALCARQHHERYDGKGYPHGLKEDEIHEYAQIIAIADVYSALTSTRMHRQRYTPGEALEYLYGAGNSQFSLSLLQLFTSQVAVSPVASTVLLNTGQLGVIAEVKPSLVTRPIVRIIRESDGSTAQLQRNLDLSLQHNVTIVNLV